MTQTSKQIRQILIAGIVTIIGLGMFKLLPMSIFGAEIEFDASAHIATAIFVLYIIWFFIDQNTTWRMPYFIFSAMVLMVISFQRIADNAHNDIGLLLGLLLGIAAIAASQWKSISGRLQF